MKYVKRILKLLLAIIVYATLSYPYVFVVIGLGLFVYIPYFFFTYIKTGDIRESENVAHELLTDMVYEKVLIPFNWVSKVLKED